jgi:hypothetical protein
VVGTSVAKFLAENKFGLRHHVSCFSLPPEIYALQVQHIDSFSLESPL